MIEDLILTNLAVNEEYSRRVLPFIESDYFSTKSQKITLKMIKDHIDKYNVNPTKTSLIVDLEEIDNISEDDFNSIKNLITGFKVDDNVELDWLVDSTEKFCQEKAVYNALMQSIEIVDGQNKNLTKGAIPKILTDALAVSFDTDVGHDYIDDAEKRYEFYHRKNDKIPFDIDLFNTITRGGFENKTLNVFMAGPNVGKSLTMTHFAGAHLAMGKNVLYVTMEMAEEKISERLDANILDVPIEDIINLTKENFLSKVRKFGAKTAGKLLTKEYPTSQANVNHLRALLNEIKLKKKFWPDIIYVDYINIMSSSRISAGNGANSYTIIKSIAEELRGLSVEHGPPVVTATQVTRSGFKNSDIDMDDVAESFGLPATADFMVALTRNDELDELGQIMVKQLKNRYADKNKTKRFVVGVDMEKMRLYNVDNSAHEGVMDSPVFDNTNTAEKFNMDKFKDFM